MARCVIIIDDLESGYVGIKAETDPPIVEGETITFAQSITVDIMKFFRDHFEGHDTPKESDGYN